MKLKTLARYLPSRRFLMLLSALGLLVGSVGGAAVVAKNWYDEQRTAEYAALSRPLVDDLARELSVSYVDAARIFVFRHTDHDMESEWYYSHADDRAYVMEHIYKTARSEPDAEKPDLACGWRVLAFKSLLAANGISADTIYLYNDIGSDPNQGSHVVLEALNPETGRLEVHDVDFNVKYLRLDKVTASLSDLMKEDVPGNFAVCDENGCGTERIEQTTVAQNDYYKGVYYRDRDVFILNREKFDISKAFTIQRLRGDEVMDVYEYFNYIYPGAPIVEF